MWGVELEESEFKTTEMIFWKRCLWLIWWTQVQSQTVRDTVKAKDGTVQKINNKILWW
jgi:hypothetical protein